MSKILLLIFFIATILFVSFIRGKMSRVEFWFAYIMLFIIVVMRSDMMADYKNYVHAYNYGAERFEPIFQIINNSLHFLYQPVISFFIVVALATVGLKLKAITLMSDLPRLSILIWMSGVLITQDMIAIRAALAGGFLFWMIYYKCNGNKKKLWLMLALAVCSHYSAIVFIVIMFISDIERQKKIYIGGLLLSALAAYSGISLTDYFSATGFDVYDKLMNNYSYQSSANAFNLVQIIRCVLCILLWGIIGKIQQENRYMLISLKIYTIGCILFFLTFKLISVSFRLGELLWTTEILIYPYLAFLLSSRYRTLGRIIPITVALMFFIFNYNFSLYWFGKHI